MTPEQLENAISDAGFEPNRYSGRNMYGKECPALVVPNDRILGAVASIVFENKDHEYADAIANAFSNAQVDNMGHDQSVIYFPIWTFDA